MVEMVDIFTIAQELYTTHTGKFCETKKKGTGYKYTEMQIEQSRIKDILNFKKILSLPLFPFSFSLSLIRRIKILIPSRISSKSNYQRWIILY